MARHLWAICKKSDTLWIKWIHIYIIKEKCLLSLKIPPNASWTVRKILKLRDEVQSWITYEVESGGDTLLWLDNWHPLGPLYQKFGEHVVCNLGRSLFVRSVLLSMRAVGLGQDKGIPLLNLLYMGLLWTCFLIVLLLILCLEPYK